MTQEARAAAPAVADARTCEILGRLALLREHRQARGMFASEKMRKPVSWTTLHQRDAMVLLELQHDVVSFGAWPLETRIRLGRTEFAYHPPLGIECQSGRMIALELLGERSCTPAEGRALEGLLAAAVREQGCGFVMLRERAVSSDACLALAREVVRASGWPVGDDVAFETVRKLADLGGSATVQCLSGGDAQLRDTVCVLVMRRVLAMDLHAPVLGDCVVRLPRRRPQRRGRA